MKNLIHKSIKNLLLSVSLVLVSVINLQAQEKISTLNVTGESTMNVRPTQTVITFQLAETKPTYSESIEALTSKVELLSKALQKADFTQQDIKTSNFNVRKNLVYDNGQREERGYIASQTVRVTFTQEKKRLLKILNHATSSKADPSIQINFELNEVDRKRLQNELLELAVADAHAKAEIIAKASNYSVAGIKNIIYRVDSPGRAPIAMRNVAYVESNPGIQNFEAADLALNESVEIEFIIERQ